MRNYWKGWSIRNSIAYVTREYFEKHAREGLISRDVAGGPLPTTIRSLLETEDPGEFRRLWRLGRNRGTVTNIRNDSELRLHWYVSWSVQDECPAEVLVLQRGRIRVGVAILVHRPQQRLGELSDLFVWPPYRRLGYGTTLEQFAAERALLAGATQLAAYVWNADVALEEERALTFVNSCGYTEIERLTNAQAAMYALRTSD